MSRNTKQSSVPPIAGDEESGGGMSMHSGGRGGGDVSTKESERHDIYASRPNRNHMGNKVSKQSQGTMMCTDHAPTSILWSAACVPSTGMAPSCACLACIICMRSSQAVMIQQPSSSYIGAMRYPPSCSPQHIHCPHPPPPSGSTHPPPASGSTHLSAGAAR